MVKQKMNNHIKFIRNSFNGQRVFYSGTQKSRKGLETAV